MSHAAEYLWELELEQIAPSFRTPRALLRPVASSQLETWPAVLATGSIGTRSFERAPGHRARLWGRRLLTRWRWAHASLPDGRSSFVHVVYTDVDGATVHCYHSPAGTLSGPALTAAGVSYEIAERERQRELEP